VLLLDNSAWARLESERLAHERAVIVAGWLERLELATCLPFLLEAGHSARSGPEHRTMMSDLERLPRVEIDRSVERLALRTQRELAEIGRHRLAPSDVVIATCAHAAGMRVLHYDSDYDVLANRISLAFESEWLAPGGTL
jgi:predicted nucleic acid-binding protein